MLKRLTLLHWSMTQFSREFAHCFANKRVGNKKHEQTQIRFVVRRRKIGALLEEVSFAGCDRPGTPWRPPRRDTRQHMDQVIRFRPQTSGAVLWRAGKLRKMEIPDVEPAGRRY